MNEQDFYCLHIGQKIWVRGEETKIKYLAHYAGEDRIACDEIIIVNTSWHSMMSKCSLEKPKEKYYLWAYENPCFIWCDSDVLTTENFLKTNGEINQFLKDLPDDKKKRLDIFIEV